MMKRWQSLTELSVSVRSNRQVENRFYLQFPFYLKSSPAWYIDWSTEPPVYLFSLSPHYGTVKPCHPYQLFCSKSWPWPHNRPKVIKRSINSPFTFDRHSRFLVVTREQTWESVRDKKLRIGTFHLLEELRSVKRNKLPSEGGLMGAEVWHSFKVFGTLQVASLTRQGWGTARWWNLFKNL